MTGRFLVCAAAFAAAACASTPDPAPRREPRAPVVERAFEIQPGSTFQPLGAARFGGLSGLAFDPASREILAVSDDRQDSRVLRLRLHEDPFAIEPIGLIPLQDTPVVIDPEGFVILPDGHLLISSEGAQNREPRSAPGLFEYTREGRFVRTLDLRERFLPPSTGPITRGVRDNASFESLALAPDGSRLFTAVETALAQDDEPATFERGSRTRILEYVRQGVTFLPGREWVYEVDAIPRPDYRPAFSINGLVELVAFDRSNLLALERGFVENADDESRSMNRIRLYRVSLEGATDVSGFDSIAGRGDLRPVSKTLVVDLEAAAGLPRELAARRLDNFEGMMLEAAPRGRSARVIIVSDDNFSAAQRTWFLRLSF